MKKSVLILLVVALVFGLSWKPAYAIKPFFDEFKAKYVKPDGTEAEKKLAEKVDKVKCNVCHKGKEKKMRNVYGEALAELLDKKEDAKNKEKIIESLDKVAEMPSDPEDEESPTFGELIERGDLPGGEEEDEGAGQQ